MPELRTKLLSLLSCLRAAANAPAGSTIDSAAVLRSCSITPEAAPELDAMIQSAIGAGPGPRERSAADWLDRFYRAARTIDPHVFEIVALRLRGLDERDIARRLGTGMRLVRRILADLSGVVASGS